MHDDLAERVYVLEAKDEIRRLMAYVHARDVTSSIDDYFTGDAVWEGVDEQVRRRWPHLAGILGPQEGRDAIVKRFAGPLPPVLHLLGNESITVHGDDAAGHWTTSNPRFWVAARTGWSAGTTLTSAARMAAGGSGTCGYKGSSRRLATRAGLRLSSSSGKQLLPGNDPPGLGAP
jgi:hypothetical protein